MDIVSFRLYHFIKERVFLLFLLCIFTINAQEGFQLPDGYKEDKVKFELANNLIIVPVTLNGVELSFILDTGVGATILFSLDNRDSLELHSASRIYFRGLGNGEPVEAIKSEKNQLKIGNAVSENHTIFLVFDESINFSPRMGFPIHGIIGYDFFKKFIVDVNYSSKYIKMNDPEFYEYKECKKCFETSLDFNEGKRPFVKAKYEIDDGLIDIRLLLDSGSGSALWLFENQQMSINVPDNSFDDFLGKGFNGDIYGRRTKINGLHIGEFVMKEVTASFPDSIYIKGISVNDRQGSLGGSVLRRFNLIVDYPNSKISFKKNSFFHKPFSYNMSGLTVQHSGVRVAEDFVKKEAETSGFNLIKNKGGEATANVSINSYGYGYSLQPKYEIAEVRPGSPADNAGVKKGDVLIEVNGRRAHGYSLSDINDLFYSEVGKKIKIKVERQGITKRFVFYLEKVI
ncbi:aspartyl protease family protein [Aquimarina sp. 2201CG14-23]|uniref:aspartyl protease family protein n=1 Tax=Aquimarina mycalae TaxID=3040073 RepID=UPI00247807FC|nr:aspartyl protease family protein [Aquimarina sp. 2201CG14-23]MDH7444595.1 aspartyl protease family protein [Aquimarina sp. 2201CG14-23]